MALLIKHKNSGVIISGKFIDIYSLDIFSIISALVHYNVCAGGKIYLIPKNN